MAACPATRAPAHPHAARCCGIAPVRDLLASPGSSREVHLSQGIQGLATELAEQNLAVEKQLFEAGTVRSFEPDSETAADWIRVLNLVGLPVLVALVGIVRFVTRRSSSVRYEREFLRSA